jgi:hypothetical protein
MTGENLDSGYSDNILTPIVSLRHSPWADGQRFQAAGGPRLRKVEAMDLASDWLELIGPDRCRKMLLRCRNPERRIASRRGKKYVRRTRRFET